MSRRLRHARRWLGYGALMLLIAIATLVGVANRLLPMVESHPLQIARWLSARVGEPVTFSRASAEWTRRGPRFILDDLHVGDAASGLRIGRAQLQIAVYSGLLPGRPLTELKVRDLSLMLVQHDDGRWKVVGLPGQGGAGDPFDRLEGFGELQIEKARLGIRAPRLKIDMDIPRIDARLRVNGPRLRAGVSAWAGKDGPPLKAVLDLQRRRHDGALWVGGKQLDLGQWKPLFAIIGVVPERGAVDVGVWGEVRDQRVERVTMEADVRRASLRSVAPIAYANGTRRFARTRIDRLQASARWDKTSNGWCIQAPRLNVTRGAHVARLDGLTLQVGKQFSLRGTELDLSPLAAMLSLTDRLPEPVRRFMQQSNPQAVLHDVSITGVHNGKWRGSMRISRMSMDAHDTRPGLSGLAGWIEFDERGGVLRLDQTPMHVRWPAGLRAEHDIVPAGTLALWQDGPGWTLGSSLLRIKGPDFGSSARLQLGFQGDGSAPTLDLVATLDPANFATAKQFWIIHRMPPATVRWLDEALIVGDVLDGRIAIGGDLDDWPFRNQTGNFDARARIRDATVKFHKQWPAGEHLDLDVAFNGPGFTLSGRGALQGNEVTRVEGGITDFHEPMLDLDIDSQGTGEALRQLMLASPLAKDYGEHLRAVSITGTAAVSTRMRFPLRADVGTRSIEGSLDIAKARLSDSRWDITLTGASGRTNFTHSGFATDNLAVLYKKQPGVFNLRVGDATGDRRTAALATLDGRFSAASLIESYASLAWLKPWMQGASKWKIAVRVPTGNGAPGRRLPSQLRVSSDLVGTTLLLPDPLRKPERIVLPLELQVPLPIEQGELSVRLGSLMRLRGQMRKDAPITGAIQFGPGAFAPFPASGLAVRGSVGRLDSTGWVAYSGQGDSQSKSSIDSVDVQASELVFIGRAFTDARLQLVRGVASTQVSLKGKGLEGSIDIPSDSARVVQGRFARMHLPSDAAPPTLAAPAAPVPMATTDTEDPAKLPPMRFTFADLRIGQAQLGKAELVTTPTTTGLRVDKFQARARNLSLDAAGEWVRAGAGTRSSFKLDFNARSLGQMLDALGYGDVVEGGPTKATLVGSWAGPPGAFGLATLGGTLKADVGEGRLLDVEPGGSGRVLGLLSLAEIPRRLSLDFSDFFKKGFAFNSARGDFRFNDGRAHTDNLRIDGPAAEIRITGNTGLREQVYDQRVEVLPKAGGLLPAIGLIAAGPAGAAVGAMAQAVFQRPLKQTTRVVYAVTGPWKKPVVKVIEKGPSRANPRANSRNAQEDP